MSVRQMKGTALACMLLPAAACAQSATPVSAPIDRSCTGPARPAGW